MHFGSNGGEFVTHFGSHGREFGTHFGSHGREFGTHFGSHGRELCAHFRSEFGHLHFQRAHSPSERRHFCRQRLKTFHGRLEAFDAIGQRLIWHCSSVPPDVEDDVTIVGVGEQRLLVARRRSS
jgi:hypothetical protein